MHSALNQNHIDQMMTGFRSIVRAGKQSGRRVVDDVVIVVSPAGKNSSEYVVRAKNKHFGCILNRAIMDQFDL